MLTHTKESIAEPLTTLPTKELEAEALKLSKVGPSLDKRICFKKLKQKIKIRATELSTKILVVY